MIQHVCVILKLLMIMSLKSTIKVHKLLNSSRLQRDVLGNKNNGFMSPVYIIYELIYLMEDLFVMVCWELQFQVYHQKNQQGCPPENLLV